MDFEPSTSFSDTGLVASVNHTNCVSDVKPDLDENEEQRSKFNVGSEYFFWKVLYLLCSAGCQKLGKGRDG